MKTLTLTEIPYESNLTFHSSKLTSYRQRDTRISSAKAPHTLLAQHRNEKKRKRRTRTTSSHEPPSAPRPRCISCNPHSYLDTISKVTVWVTAHSSPWGMHKPPWPQALRNPSLKEGSSFTIRPDQAPIACSNNPRYGNDISAYSATRRMPVPVVTIPHGTVCTRDRRRSVQDFPIRLRPQTVASGSE